MSKENNKKIIILCSTLPNLTGGIETYTREMIRNLIKKEYTIYIIGTHNIHFKDIYSLLKPSSKINVYPIKGGNFPIIKKLIYFFNYISTSIKIIKKEKIHLAHAHNIYPPGFIGAILKLLTKNLKLIITEHGSVLLYRKNPLMFPFLTLTGFLCDYIISASSELKLLIDRFILINREKKSIYRSNVIDLKKYRTLKIKNSKKLKEKLKIKDEFIILSLRRLDPKTGVQYLPEIAKELKKYYLKFKFLVIGEGPQKEIISKKIKNYNLENHFILLGKIENEKVKDYILISHIGIFPSFAEATSIAALEIMACGRPVIATNIGGLKDIIKNNYNGFLVEVPFKFSDYKQRTFPSQVIKEFAFQINKLIQNRNILQKMGKNARREVVNNYTWEKYIDFLINIYKRYESSFNK